jgi:hypothetical protein
MDPILFIGGCVFIAFSFLSFFDRDTLWRIYNLERGWRRLHPERTPEWDQQARRYGRVFLAIGVVSCALSFFAGG